MNVRLRHVSREGTVQVLEVKVPPGLLWLSLLCRLSSHFTLTASTSGQNLFKLLYEVPKMVIIYDLTSGIRVIVQFVRYVYELISFSCVS